MPTPDWPPLPSLAAPRLCPGTVPAAHAAWAPGPAPETCPRRRLPGRPSVCPVPVSARRPRVLLRLSTAVTRSHPVAGTCSAGPALAPQNGWAKCGHHKTFSKLQEPAEHRALRHANGGVGWALRPPSRPCLFRKPHSVGGGPWVVPQCSCFKTLLFLRLERIVQVLDTGQM